MSTCTTTAWLWHSRCLMAGFCQCAVPCHAGNKRFVSPHSASCLGTCICAALTSAHAALLEGNGEVAVTTPKQRDLINNINKHLKPEAQDAQGTGPWCRLSNGQLCCPARQGSPARNDGRSFNRKQTLKSGNLIQKWIGKNTVNVPVLFEILLGAFNV